MKNAGKTKHFRRRRLLGPLAALALVLPALALFSTTARADEDPFQFDSGHWMSSAHYQDASKRGTLDLPVPMPETPAADQTPAISSPTAATQTVAAPARPIDLPVMPGLNKGFDVKVTSTDDEASETPAPVIEKDQSTDIHLSDKNWALPAAARTQAAKADDNGDDAPAPINVRMTYLPNAAVTPIPSPEHASAARAAHIALEKSIENKNHPPAKAQEQAAACAAIDAYKKQQLDAIQSDRQTLKALQDAISSLGLQKQLGFITGSNSNLSLSGAPANMDTPPATTVR